MSPFPKRKQVVETLVRKGAHLNEKNKELLTSLHVATDLSHYDMMETLLRLGAKVNALDALGQTGEFMLLTNSYFSQFKLLNVRLVIAEVQQNLVCLDYVYQYLWID